MSAPAVPATPSSERRIAPRRQPAMGTICRLDSADGGPSPIVLVWNISNTGISVLAPAARTAGAMLFGFLEKTEGDHMLRVAMRVVHTKLLETGDYFLGAHFDRPLTDDELKPFVAEV